MFRHYKPEELKIGMRVRKEELRDIYGLWIYFDWYNTETGGTIICISDKKYSDEVAEALKQNGNVLSMFYQNPLKRSGNVRFI